MTYISMVNRMSYDYSINPAILTDGMLWFKDLSSPDPTGILPVMIGITQYLNMISNPASQNNTFRRFMKFFKIMPIMFVPVAMTFPSAVNIYFLVFQWIQFILINSFRSPAVRRFFGVP